MPLEDRSLLPQTIDRYTTLCEALVNFPGTIVCFVQGRVRGGGLAFPAAAHVCYCTAEASFGLPEVRAQLTGSCPQKARGAGVYVSY